jgi:hypothetical protein
LFVDKDREPDIRAFMLMHKDVSREEAEKVFDAIEAAEIEVAALEGSR